MSYICEIFSFYYCAIVCINDVNQTLFLQRPITCHDWYSGAVKIQLYSYLILFLDGVGVCHYAPAALLRGKNNVTLCRGVRVKTRASLEAYGEEKISSPQGFEPKTSLPLAIRCTDYTVPVSEWSWKAQIFCFLQVTPRMYLKVRVC